MIFDYNILFDGVEYFVYADKYPDINSSFDWENSTKEIYEDVVLAIGPSGKLVDIDEERNNNNYISNKSTVARKKEYTNIEEKEYDASSIRVDEYGNYISYDEWLFDELQPLLLRCLYDEQQHLSDLSLLFRCAEIGVELK